MQCIYYNTLQYTIFSYKSTIHKFTFLSVKLFQHIFHNYALTMKGMYMSINISHLSTRGLNSSYLHGPTEQINRVS